MRGIFLKRSALNALFSILVLAASSHAAESGKGVSFPLSGLWKKSLTPGAPAFVHDGTVYAASGKRLYALGADTGEVLWKFTGSSPIESAPAADSLRVYFGTADGNLYSLDRKTGSELWRFQTKSEVRSRAVISGEGVYIRSSDDTVYALKKDTGERLWFYQHSAAHYAAPLIEDSIAAGVEKIFSLFSDGTLVALDAVTGKELWKKAISIERARIFPSGGSLYAMDGAAVVLLSAKTGEEIQRWGAVDFAVSEKTLAVLERKGVVTRDVPSGGILWERGLEAETLSLADSHLVTLTEAESRFFKRRHTVVNVFDGSTGKPVWKRSFGSKVLGVSVFGETVVFSTEKGVEAFTGKKDHG